MSPGEASRRVAQLEGVIRTARKGREVMISRLPLLQADGFPVPEVFKRIGSVLGPPPADFAGMHRKMGGWSDPLRKLVPRVRGASR